MPHLSLFVSGPYVVHVMLLALPSLLVHVPSPKTHMLRPRSLIHTSAVYYQSDPVGKHKHAFSSVFQSTIPKPKQTGEITGLLLNWTVTSPDWEFGVRVFFRVTATPEPGRPEGNQPC